MFQAPRGTSDVLPAEQSSWSFAQSTAQRVASTFGYERIDTPIFEDAGLFVRSIGEVTDLVEKETYTFEDRGGDLVTLRAEGTAPVCRAYLQNGMHNLPQPVRLYYFCPVFRYERPQAGRVREHHQFGIEVLGDGDPAIDAEVIEVAWRTVEAVGLKDLTLKVNSTGDAVCRPDFVSRLKGHYAPHVDRLCPDCKRRLVHNPLRLLDCKVEACQPVIAGAPSSVDSLCDACSAHWSEMLGYLELLDIPAEVDNRLVRGLDYYTRTVFEIVPPTEGRMTTIVGGGRYDGLMEQLGGRPTPGIGFGMGIERVIANLELQEAAIPEERPVKVLVAHVGDNAKKAALTLSSELRRGGVGAVLAPPARSLRSQLRYASAVSATHAVIMGDEELSKGAATVRDLEKGEQREVPIEQVRDIFGPTSESTEINEVDS